MKVCDKTCIFCFFPVINKYLCMAKRSLLSERPSYIQVLLPFIHKWNALVPSNSVYVKKQVSNT